MVASLVFGCPVIPKRRWLSAAKFLSIQTLLSRGWKRLVRAGNPCQGLDLEKGACMRVLDGLEDSISHSGGGRFTLVISVERTMAV